VTGNSADRHAQLDLSFARRGDRTVLDRRRFRWPFVLTRTFALDSCPRHMLTVIVQTSSGALHGEDRLSQWFEVGENAAAHITTQGASAVHRASGGLESRDSARLSVAQGGFLEYLPEPRILFPGAALEQTLEIECAPGGTALVCDAFTIHHIGCRGCGFRRFRSATILRCGGDPVLVDRMDIDGLIAGKSAAFRAFASLVVAAPGWSAAGRAPRRRALSVAGVASRTLRRGQFAPGGGRDGHTPRGARVAQRQSRNRRNLVRCSFGALRRATELEPQGRRPCVHPRRGAERFASVFGAIGAWNGAAGPADARQGSRLPRTRLRRLAKSARLCAFS
jgi:urease accessory protein